MPLFLVRSYASFAMAWEVGKPSIVSGRSVLVLVLVRILD